MKSTSIAASVTDPRVGHRDLTKTFLQKKLDTTSIEGELPVELGDLTKLETIDLSYNELSGYIPCEFGQLEALKKLDLSGNSLTGSIPIELPDLPALRELHLAENEFVGELPEGFLLHSTLRILDVSGNQLTEVDVTKEIEVSPVLQYLNLANNRLVGAFPVGITSLESLSELFFKPEQPRRFDSNRNFKATEPSYASGFRQSKAHRCTVERVNQTSSSHPYAGTRHGDMCVE